MENIGYYNGKFDLIEKMTVPMNDRAMYFGDGVYDATYSVNRTIFALEDHLDRFTTAAGCSKYLLRCRVKSLKRHSMSA